MGLFYTGFCWQVFWGFPPVYRTDGPFSSIFIGTFPDDEEVTFLIKTIAPVGVMAFAEILIQHPVVSAAWLITGAVAGIAIRQKVKRRYGVVLPSIIHPFPDRWPMFAFDVWTCGGTLLLASLFLAR